ncbi:MAG: pyridoxamine 5'-phosphate oxidase family protein [bacterium]
MASLTVSTQQTREPPDPPAAGRTEPELDDRLLEAFKGDMTPKFMATRDRDGTPNVVPIISVQPFDRRTLIFGNFFMCKTERNLKEDPRVSVAVFTKGLYGATVRGRFDGFRTTGEHVDIVNASPTLRYNAYMGVRSAGAIRIAGAPEPFQWSRLAVVSGHLASKIHRGPARRLSAGRKMLHPLVAQKFARIAAVKAISFLDPQGYPCAVPVMALEPAAPDVLLFPKQPMAEALRELREGVRTAASVITLEPVAFQIKGTFREVNANWGAIVVDRVYHASPPYVGKEIRPFGGCR